MRRGIEKYSSAVDYVVSIRLLHDISIFRIIGIRFTRFKISSTSFSNFLPTPPIPPFPFHRNDHLSHFLFPLFKFFKNTSASSFSNRFLNRSEPTPKSVFTVFRFLLLFSNFFSRSFQITIAPPFSTLFSQGNIQLLSTSSNFLKPQISFLE